MSLFGTFITNITKNQNLSQEFPLHSSVAQYHHHYQNKDFSIGYLDNFYEKQAKNLGNARQLLRSEVGKHDSNEGLVMVDTMQRLGIDYHFEEEIDSFLKWQYYMVMTTHNYVHKYKSLSEVSLCFRLLRQQGYYVPADFAFGRFKCKDGKFKEKLEEDISGLIELYEASHLCIKGENILDEAAMFSSQLLKEKMAFMDEHQTRIARNTLDHPYHKSLVKFMAQKYVNDCRATKGWQNVLVEIAKTDLNMVGSIHKKELGKISRWWKNLGLTKELNLIRDQPLKWYTGPMASLTDPNMSKQRIDLTKVLSLVYVIDDMFDVYGTLEELTLFVDAVSRWDLACMDQLPDYMKLCFKTLYLITNEIGDEIHKKYGYNPTHSLQKTWSSLCDAFLVEAKWFASGHLPNPEEYLKNGIISSGIHVVLIHLLFLLGEGKNVLSHNSRLISSAATILRLWDDLGTAKDENQDGSDGSYLTCFMNEHRGFTIETARQHVTEMIAEEWKSLNKECLSPNLFSATFKKATLNLARIVPLMYNYDDNQRLPVLEANIKSMFSDSCIPQESSLY